MHMDKHLYVESAHLHQKMVMRHGIGQALQHLTKPCLGWLSRGPLVSARYLPNGLNGPVELTSDMFHACLKKRGAQLP